MLPLQFEFEQADRGRNLTRKYAHKNLGALLLLASILGGSSLGVMSNFIQAEGPFLKNAWRFQALLFVFVFMVPFFFLYDRYYLRYERYRAYIRQLHERGVYLKKKENQIKVMVSQNPQPYEEKYPRSSEVQSVQALENDKENFE